jgi:hypothetical protein
MSYARWSAYSLMSNLLNGHDTCYEDSELWFITFKVKTGSKGLWNDDYFKNMIS